MRLKYSNKKLRIVTMAAEKNINKNSQSQVDTGSYDYFVGQIISSKQNLKKSQEINSNMESSIKSNFKQCKIKDFIGINNHSPTHSDIDYIDSIQNYKSYLKKSKKQRTKINKSKRKIQISGQKKQNIINQHRQCIINKSFGLQQIQKRQKLKIIQQKIEKVKNLSFKYNSQRQFQNVYQQIYQTDKTEQSLDQMQPDQFQLVSVKDYLKSIQNCQLSSKRQNNLDQNKNFAKKFAKRPASHEAKKWYQPKNSHTQRKVDPQSLISMINLENSTHKKNQYQKQSQKRHQTIISQKQYTTIQSKLNTSEFSKIRPKTAPFPKKSKIITEQSSSFKIQNEKNKNHKQSIGKFPDNELYLRQKVKGIRHVEKQKFGWKDLKKQIQMFNSNGIIRKKHKAEVIFQYPWNKGHKSFLIKKQSFQM